MNFRSFYLLLIALVLLTSRLCAQDVRITEFLATNTTGITDENLTAQPWIELWNPSTTAKVSLTSWALSNGTTSWTFPAVEIMPDERMIIWASGKDRKIVTAPLHTNFTLPAGGGTLTLTRPGATIASQIAAYPAQNANVSFGRDEWDAAVIPTQVGFYTKPTPGERNNFSGTGVSGKVLIDIASKAFTGSMTVTLSQAVQNPAAVIRYTINGTVPTATSSQYSAPLTVNTTQMIRARVFQSGLLPGETETRGYLLLDASTSNFSSAMPIVVLSNFGLGQPPDTTDQSAFLWVWEPAAPDNRSRLTNLPTIATRTAIDRRGSSTLNNAKYNLNVESRKARDDDDADISLLGMPAGSDYVFSGPFDYDVSEVHNPFIYALSNQIGRYAPATRFAEVFMDVGGGAVTFTGNASGDYFGIYNILEKIRRDKNRVNIEKLDTYDNDPVNKTGGYIFKVDRLDTGDSGFTAGGQSMAYYYPKELEIKSPQRDPQEQYLTSYINSFNTALQSSTWNNPTTGYAAWLDVPAAIDHHLLVTWPMNVDGLRLSGYWFKDRGGKLVPGPIWDFDRALSSTDGRDANPSVWRSQSGDLGTDFFNYIWWNRLFQDINFYQKYIDRWQFLRRSTFSAANVNALLDSLNAQISAEAITRDLVRWGKSKRAWTSPFTGTPYPASQAAEIQRLKDWLQQRANFFDSQWVGPVNASTSEGNVAPNTQVTLTGPAGAIIYYTLDGTDPRPSGGGAPAAGVLRYVTGTPITISSTARIRARAYNASWLTNSAVLVGANNPPLRSAWSGLTSLRYSTDTPALASNLTVTEVNYHPVNPTAGELTGNPNYSDSDFEFIELHNTGAAPIDLGGLKFTAGITFAFSGENALSLPAGGYVIVAANPVAFTARYPGVGPVVGPWVGDLANGGEQLVLKSASASTIFDFTYDDAWYPLTDGTGRTLIIFDENAAPPAFSTAANWRASALAGGSPGAIDPDVTAPVVAGPFTPLTIATGVNGTAVLPDYTLIANASDKVGVVSITQTPAASATLSVGVAHVVVTAKDAAGNSGTAAFDVNITDGTAPVIAGTFSPASVSTGVNGTAVVPDYAAQAQVSDNVGVTSVTQSPLAGTPIGAGSKTVTISASDAVGNIGTKIVPLEVLDATPPVLGGTFAPLALSTGANGTALLPDYTMQAEVSDNVGAGVVTQVPAPGTALNVGTTSVTLSVQDEAGNKTSTTFDVAVLDGTVPFLGGTFTPLIISTGVNGTAAVPNYAIQAIGTDNVGVVTVDQVPAPGSPIGAGTTIVTLTAHDASGNAASLSINLTVVAGVTAEGAPVPGIPGAAFTAFGIPSINDAGAIAFSAKWKQPGGAGAGILSGNPVGLLAKTGDSVPGVEGAAFKAFSDPVINAEGKVAFLATIKGKGISASSDSVLVTNAFAGGALKVVAQEGKPAGEADFSTIKSFRSISLQGAEVLYVAMLKGGSPAVKSTTAMAAFRVTDDSGPHRVVRAGQPFKGTLIKSFQMLAVVAGSPGQNRSHFEGTATFLALLKEGGEALLDSTGTELTPIAITGGLVNSATLPAAATFQSFGPVAADSTSVTMAATFNSGSKAIFLNSTSGFEPIAQVNTEAPGTNGAIFKTLGDPVLAPLTGAIAFPATVYGSTSQDATLWWKPTDGGLKLIAREGFQPPGVPIGARWKAFPSLAIRGGAQGGPLFYAQMASGAGGVNAKNDFGIWAIDSNSELRLIVREGDPIGNKVIKTITVLSAVSGSPGVTRSFNNTQFIIYRATFTDNSQAVLTAVIP